MNLSYVKVSLFALSVITLTACSNGMGDKSKAMKTINEGLAKNPICRNVPVGVVANEASLKSSIAIPALMELGYIEEGQVMQRSSWDGRMIPHKGYHFTEKGRPLIIKPADPNKLSSPCVAMGRFEIVSVEAVDEGTDMSGKTIVNVRTRGHFVTHDWVESRRNDPAWQEFFDSVKKQESRQWMYQLLKSGDSFFYQGPGKGVD